MTEPSGTRPIRFFHRGRIVELADLPVTRSVLDWLREDARLTGTKEGCNEGDCGACTVVVGELAAPGDPLARGGLRLRPVNACLRFLPSLDGRALFTVEDLRGIGGGALHPVQQAMVDHHGSQCGFCTPGIVMSLWALYEARGGDGPRPGRGELAEALAGNLCRCTGYRPILDAGQAMFDAPPRALDTAPVVAALQALRADGPLAYAPPQGGGRWQAPRTLAGLAALREQQPEARLVAGTTDVALWVNKQFRPLGDLIATGAVDELACIAEHDAELHIGAAVPLEDAWAALAARVPDLAAMGRRFGSPPVRHAGTMGGNLANGSPIGDSAPVLMALDAGLLLRRGAATRRLPLDGFYVDYLKNRLEPGEFLQAIVVPQAAFQRRIRAYKIGKRFDCDISALAAGLAVELDGERVSTVRLAFGGLAATVRRAAAAEAALLGRPWSRESLQAAVAALAQDFRPLSDLRASAGYRLQVARNLLLRFWLETRPQDPLPPSATQVWGPLPEAANPRLDAASEAQAAAGGARVGLSLPHESAHLHVSGGADYVDDLPELAGTLHAAPGLSPVAQGRLLGVDRDTLRALPGVVAVLTAADIPGRNDCGPIVHDDPILADGELRHLGQPVFLVVAHTRDAARRAAARSRDCVRIEARPPVLDARDAHAQGRQVLPPMHLSRSVSGAGAAAAIAAAPRRLQTRFEVGGQQHFYLEGQVSVAVPLEDGALRVHCSTQHPTEMQHAVAYALALPAHRVQVECRRMGGGFGGKESQSAQFACLAAVAAVRLGRPVKLRLDRDDDFLATGGRHGFGFDLDVGFDDEGRLLGAEVTMIANAGHSADLSGPVMTRALCHFDNAYWLPEVAMHGHAARTDLQSNTAFRGFGGPQGAIAIEHVIDTIARRLGRDPLDVRRANFYGRGERDTTPYGQPVADNLIDALVAELEAGSDYRARRAELAAFNATSPVIKRGLALTPVKFGISFNLRHFNQAGALVHVYTDGSVLVNHGGTEMGQGLNTKVAQVVAHELGLDAARVRCTATDTQKVPNTSATAASTGADLNGKAAQDAARRIRERLAACAAGRLGGSADAVRFANGQVGANGRTIAFEDLVAQAYTERVQLWSDGFYATPGLHWDRERLQGHPFFYFAYGAAVSEVRLDTLTGETRLVRTDILHDAGRSLNPALDIGQIEGGFVQGLGWLTSEELVWHPASGALLTHSPSTYKIPTAHDAPPQFHVRLWPGDNREDSIHRSKAVGEPPLLLAFSAFFAIRDAISAAGGHRRDPPLDAPATPEAVLRALAAMRA